MPVWSEEQLHPSLQTPRGCCARPVLQPQLGHGEHRWVMLGAIPTEWTPPSSTFWGLDTPIKYGGI